ncbi:hypothetical protein PRZ48_014277 [Zasmidium cellare]|uniref:DUF2278 family protein n=1 Tax=Zasmidium cellare TaxID=395010 RepID=A0ABR0E147_ZASCE|nr:hypothetical protein PRZ48_014277 [Zasmidium cellare]
MSLKRYGVWVVKPESYDAQTPRQDSKSPHITLKFTDDGSGGSAEINVKSLDQDKRLVYWVNRNFTHPITSDLDNLNLGLRNITKGSKSDLALDFQRTEPSLFNLKQGEILPHYAQGPNNDILDKLEPILTQAIKEKATMYIFGQSYHDSDGVDGIHDIHMNQGNEKGFENSIYSDGSFFVRFKDGHWEAVGLAFASQALPTDEKGDPEQGARRFDQVLEGS